jgi:hypothetical protein
MRAVVKRVARLENGQARHRDYLRDPSKRCRVIVSRMDRPARLENSTCKRTLSGGFLTEVVRLDGMREGLADDQLERFIESFPIRPV